MLKPESAFRRRLRDIRQAPACECNACILVPDLDLKFVVHHGRVARQRIGSSEELIGSDVIVVHRLLKSSVAEATGFGAYALYTDACVAAMGLSEPSEAGMVRHSEAFEDLGDIGCWVVDLHAAWAAELERSRLVVEADGALMTAEGTVEAPRALAWEYITSPQRRPLWQYGVEAVIPSGGPAGRRGIGTVNHCMHGKDAIIEEVVDWQPDEYVTYRSLVPAPGAPPLLSSFVLTDLGDGRTQISFRIGRPRSAKERAFADQLVPMLNQMIDNGLAALVPLLTQAAKEAASVEVAPEPALPVSQGRNTAEPIGSGA